jgi:SAM-dependent methyltransferase
MAPTESATFYDEHPFDWTPPQGADDASSLAAPLAELVDTLGHADLVLDVGCGPGRVLGALARRGVRCIGLDRSRVSVTLAVERYGKPCVVGDNLQLPFADGCADVIISDGVIHHTLDPRAAFAENARVVKPGGRMYLAVYKASGRYPLLYNFPGGLIRKGLLRWWSRPLVVLLAQFPYFMIHFVRSRGRRTWSGARNLFYDYFVTPQVAFFTRSAVESWSDLCGVRLERYDQNPKLNVHSFLFRKRSTAAEKESQSGSYAAAVSSARGAA